MSLGLSDPISELFGTAEVARELGIPVSNVDVVRGLPAPVQRVAATRLWDANEIRVFAIGYKARRKDRVAKQMH